MAGSRLGGTASCSGVRLVARAGLLLAPFAAFAPWHATPAGLTLPAGLVELHSPDDARAPARSTATWASAAVTA